MSDKALKKPATGLIKPTPRSGPPTTPKNSSPKTFVVDRSKSSAKV